MCHRSRSSLLTAAISMACSLKVGYANILCQHYFVEYSRNMLCHMAPVQGTLASVLQKLTHKPSAMGWGACASSHCSHVVLVA